MSLELTLFLNVMLTTLTSGLSVVENRLCEDYVTPSAKVRFLYFIDR